MSPDSSHQIRERLFEHGSLHLRTKNTANCPVNQLSALQPLQAVSRAGSTPCDMYHVIVVCLRCSPRAAARLHYFTHAHINSLLIFSHELQLLRLRPALAECRTARLGDVNVVQIRFAFGFHQDADYETLDNRSGC